MVLQPGQINYLPQTGGRNISVYKLPSDSRSLRRPQYFCSAISLTSFNKSAYNLTTVLNSTWDTVTLHSTASQTSAPTNQTSTLQEWLQSMTNPERWGNLKCSGNGWWIWDTLLEGTLVMVSDGSYMPNRHTGACSSAFVLKCTRIK